MRIITGWIFIGIIILALITYIVVTILRDTRNLRASKKWPETTGRVTGLSVSRHSGYRGGIRFDATITYSYSAADGKLYRNTFKIPVGATDEAATRNTIDYANGSKLVVRYNPEDPQAAVVIKR